MNYSPRSLNLPTLINYANWLADKLSSVEGVIRVELFGSLARNEAHPLSDIDLIVIVEDDLASEWMMLVNCLGQVIYMVPDSRLAAAAEVLEQRWLADGWASYADMFLFPPDWRNRLDELQLVGNHTDPEFMHNIARDATRYDLELRSFPVFLLNQG